MKTKKRTWVIVIVTILILALIGMGMVAYGFFVEPHLVKVNKFKLGLQGSDATQVRVVQISDLHIKSDFTSESLAKIVDKINLQNPDIVLFTGDLYDNYAKYNDDENVIAELGRIKVTLAKFAVWGNHDYGGGGVRKYENIINSAGFVLLKNQYSYVDLPQGKRILLTGLDDSMLGSPKLPTRSSEESSDYEILITHNAQDTLNYQQSGYNFALGGHTHGGQVDIPFLPFVNDIALSAVSLSTEYGRGMYSLDGENSQNLYVNSGIGTTKITVRFGVVPEIAVFDIGV